MVVFSDRQTVTYNSAGALSPALQPNNFYTQKQNTSVVPVFVVADGAGLVQQATLLTGGAIYTNYNTNSQNLPGWDFTNATIGSAVAGPDTTLTAYPSTDNSAVVTQYSAQGLDGLVPLGELGNTFYVSFFVLKTTGATTFPCYRVTVDGGVENLCVNTNNGVITTLNGGSGSLDCGTYWYVYGTLVGGNTAGPGQTGNYYPAFGLLSNFGVQNVAAMGTTTPWGFQVTKVAQVSYIPSDATQRSGVQAATVNMTAADFDLARNGTTGVFVTARIVDTGGLLTDRISVLKVQDGQTGSTGSTGPQGPPGSAGAAKPPPVATTVGLSPISSITVPPLGTVPVDANLYGQVTGAGAGTSTWRVATEYNFGTGWFNLDNGIAGEDPGVGLNGFVYCYSSIPYTDVTAQERLVQFRATGAKVVGSDPGHNLTVTNGTSFMQVG
jgi:hypothetical protein